jgi:hypothetical protein
MQFNENKADLEIDTSEELKQLGFDKFILPAQGRNSFIWYKGRPIVASFERKDLSKTVKLLTKKFQAEGLDERSIRHFITYFTEEYLKLKESELSKPSATSLISTDEQETSNQIAEGIKRLKAANQGITFENWLESLKQRYENIKSISEKNFPNSWPGIEFTLSVQKILNISECTLPFAGIMLARSGGNKTLCTSIITPWPHVYYTRNFTARAFVSHNTSVAKEYLAEIDMLPKIRFKTLLTPELTPLFSANEDDLMENLGIITSILDGKGYISHSGAHGRRGYHGSYMFTWVGAAVDIPYRVHKLLATLGPKLYFFRLPFKEKSDLELSECMNENFEKKRKEVQDTVIDYLIWYEICPKLIEDKESDILKMRWDSKNDDEQAKYYLMNLGKLLARLRGHVDIWSPKKHEYSEYAYSYTQTEDPTRAIMQLYNLARGHALLLGRSHITLEDVPITAKVVLSTASIERVAVMDLLLAKGGHITLAQIAKTLSMSKSTALKTMTELAALKVVDKDDFEVECNNTKEIRLRPEFGWLLSKEFAKLREGFTPIDNSEYNNEAKQRIL